VRGLAEPALEENAPIAPHERDVVPIAGIGNLLNLHPKSPRMLRKQKRQESRA
jgi:hypothetical protein